MLTRILAAVLAVTLLAGWSASVRADAKAATTTTETAKVDDGGETAFIDLPAKWDLSIYTLIVFGVLFLILYVFAWPKITEGLKKREAMLSAVKDEAIKAKLAAEAAQARLDAEFAQANDKVRFMLEEARRDADALRAKEREAGQKEAAAERDRAKREINSAKDAALQEIYQKAVDLAALMSSKAVRRNMSAADHKNLVDESVAELKTMAR